MTRNLAIEANKISKVYRVGESYSTYQSLRESITETISSQLDRWRTPKSSQKKTQNFWALQEVSFSIHQGEVVGIIGRNGAGKSTLLKILARITRPTHGTARIYGRVGSLLEIGTGFHPELTGRENIYLSGAIIGMKRVEIKQKFDEIVDFANIETFLDTPVKRYSSGMYVRLAFAVAAHLEPEILLVDEVLAVGDLAFQKKCMGRMGEIARTGRTVLFVSHNMNAIRSLCERTFLIHKGHLQADGPSGQVIREYIAASGVLDNNQGEITWEENEGAPGNDEIRLISIRMVTTDGKVQNTFDGNLPIQAEIIYRVYRPLRGMRLVLVVLTREGVTVFASTDQEQRPIETNPGVYRSVATIPPFLLNQNQYTIQIHAGIPGVRVLIPGEDFISFTCVSASGHGSSHTERWPGVVSPRLEWSFEEVKHQKQNDPKSV
jgi:lipopolysaccharide transport system ATP-binding protein